MTSKRNCTRMGMLTFISYNFAEDISQQRRTRDCSSYSAAVSRAGMGWICILSKGGASHSLIEERRCNDVKAKRHENGYAYFHFLQFRGKRHSTANGKGTAAAIAEL